MKQTSGSRKFLLALMVLGGLSIGVSSFALVLDWPASPGGIDLNNLTGGNELPEMIAYFYEWGIAIGGLAAFAALVSAGFQYLTSVGDPAKMGDALNKITSAVFGVFLLLSSFLILETINPELVALKTPTDIPEPSVNLEEEQFTLQVKDCEEAILYDGTYYSGTAHTNISLGDPCEPLGGKTVASIEIKGSCTLYLFQDPCPGGDPTGMLVITADTPDVEGRYGIASFGSGSMQLGTEPPPPEITCWDSCDATCEFNGGALDAFCTSWECDFNGEFPLPAGDLWCQENMFQDNCCCSCVFPLGF